MTQIMCACFSLFFGAGALGRHRLQGEGGVAVCINFYVSIVGMRAINSCCGLMWSLMRHDRASP